MRFSISLFLGLTVCCTVGLAQVKQQFARQLIGQTVILRDFYTGEKLNFDAKGVLISGGTAGSGPADGTVYVEAVKLQRNKVIIHGERRISVFNPGTGETGFLGPHEGVKIEAALPSGGSASAAATEMLHRIFLTPAETNQLACSAGEEKIFCDHMLRIWELVSAPKDDKQNNDEPRQLCFLDGNHAYVVGNGVTAPKPLKTPDPVYPLIQLKLVENHATVSYPENSRVVLALIIDSGGSPTSPVILGAHADVFDAAVINTVLGWKFQPATYQSEPVPAAISVEVNFHLRCFVNCNEARGEGSPLWTVQTTLSLN